MRKRRPVLAVIGALVLWGGVACTLLFGAAAAWLLTQGLHPSWILLAASAALALLGLLLVRLSRVPLGEALNL